MSQLDAPLRAKTDVQDASLAFSREVVAAQGNADSTRGTASSQVANIGQTSPCYSGFELSKECIAESGLEQQVKDYEQILKDAMRRLDSSYKVDLRVVNSEVLNME